MQHLRPNASRPSFALSPVALVAIAVLQSQAAWAQESQPALRASPVLREDIPASARGELPTFVSGERIHGRTDLETTVEGDAELRRGDTVIRADRLEYLQPQDKARATGNVRINKAGDVFEGPLLELEVDAFQGFFNQPRYKFLRNDAHGEAERVDFLGEKHALIKNATYTTCKREPGPRWMPDWILRASSLRLDNEEEVGYARNAVLSFMGVPFLPVPLMSFPLSDKRKSGVLPPTYGVDSVSGVELTLPYYWNIAPNRDATLYPTLMSKRGVDLGAEFRYLERDYNGTIRGNYLPGDRLRNRDRWGFAARHDGVLQLGSLKDVGLSLNLNRVSDDNYWRDFSRSSSSLTQRLLANEGTVSWARGNFSFRGRVLKWQTLQDPTARITPPYDRAPQLAGRYARTDLPGGFEASVDVDHTRFVSERTLTGQPNAQRDFVWGQLSRPWQAPGWFVIPKVQLHSAHYQFDAPLASNGARNANRTVPTFSLDSGLVFERDATYFGRNIRQTLEPRAFYVHTPYREQNHLPNYDSGRNDFNFATIFTENEFGGHDRISDSKLLTLGASSRFLDADSGAELARVSIAQRLRFKDQQVILPGGTPVSERLSDMLFGTTLNWSPQWTASATVQYNPKTARSVRSVLGASYHPGNYRVLSAAYRLQRGSSEQLDIGWQWPLSDLFGKSAEPSEGRWYSVGRLNFSMRERRLVDGIVGLEYDAGCWIGRVVVERLQSSSSKSNKRILLQLEFNGLSRLGSNALQTLKDTIPRYQYLREHVTTPSRFSNYE
jgi:LPS-assembly protein